MTSELDQLYRLKKSDVLKAGEVASRAYIEVQEPYYFVFDNPNKRLKNYHYLCDFPIRYCVKYGEAYAPSSKIEGVAGWAFFQQYKIKAWQAIRSGFLNTVFRTSGGSLKKILSIINFQGKLHKRNINIPHWCFFILAIDPVHQGNRYASKLIRPMLSKIDEVGYSCYLDTASEKNVSIYQHFGFEIVEETMLPRTDFRWWAMLRR